MNTYRLKDSELQKQLDEISGGDFSEKLQEKAKNLTRLNFIQVVFSREKGKNTRWYEAWFRSEEIEELKEYDPRAWNDYPDVKPPKDGIYRVEVFYEKTDLSPDIQAAGHWDGSRWRVDDPRGGGGFPLYEGKRLRFRPWEDPE